MEAKSKVGLSEQNPPTVHSTGVLGSHLLTAPSLGGGVLPVPGTSGVGFKLGNSENDTF